MKTTVNPAWIVKRHPGDVRAQVNELLSKGYRLDHHHENWKTAQLRKPKRFRLIIAVPALVFGLIGFFAYVLWYLASSDKVIFLDAKTQ